MLRNLAMAALLTALVVGGAPAPAAGAPVQSVAPSAVRTATFPDVPSSHRYATEIAWLAKEKITTGYTSDGTFRPTRRVTRGELAAFLYRYAHGGKEPAKCTRKPFPDVATSNRFCGHITWLGQVGVIKGYANGRFGPDHNIRRDHIAIMLARFRAMSAPVDTTCNRTLFPDIMDSDSCWAVTWLAGTGITTGYGSGDFRPKTHTSRQHMAAFLYRYHAKFGRPVLVPPSFTLRGSGYGHGVGMAQYGAYAQALAGRSQAQILQHYYKGAKVETRDTPEIISVQVFGPEPYSYAPGRYSDTASSTTIMIDGGRWRLREDGVGTVANGTGKTSLTVSTSGGNVRVAVGGKTYAGATMRLHWSGTRYYYEDEAGPVVTVKGAHGSYRHGRFTLTAIGGVPNIVNDLLLNTEYLYGIAEMPSSWGEKGRAALSAQAIAARSYAMTRSKSTKCGCHVVDDVRDQHFTGWNKENEGNGRWGALWKAAVDATVTSSTRAQVLTYDGKPIATHYFSSSGGRTENSEDVWSSRVAYERGVADQWSLDAPGNTMTSWTRTLSQSAAAKLFNLPDVKSITVSKRYSGGAIAQLTATSSSGTKRSISGKSDQLRSQLSNAISGSSLPSPWITSIKAN